MTDTSKEKPTTIYLTRTGLLEPLGRSQVLAYLIGLSERYNITLISFEKPDDFADGRDLADIETLCAEHGIDWIRLAYRSKPRVLAAGLNWLSMVLYSLQVTKKKRAALIHARSYLPAAAAWITSRAIGTPFVFDMRSLWPEELITSKRLVRDSLLHRFIFWVEGRLLRDAAIVVSLTHVAVMYLNKVHPGSIEANRLAIIPTCADLSRFRPAHVRHADPIIIGCHGSLTSGWFRIDLLVAVFKRLAEVLPTAVFQIITREDPTRIRSVLTSVCEENVSTMTRVKCGYWLDRLTITSAKPTEIASHIQQQSLSVFFYASGATSELGRSPTRMAEALGCGVPVLTNVGIGDLAEFIQKEEVGVILEGEDERQIDQAIRRALAMIQHPNIRRRCREVAERTYSLESGVQAYDQIYKKVALR